MNPDQFEMLAKKVIPVLIVGFSALRVLWVAFFTWDLQKVKTAFDKSFDDLAEYAATTEDQYDDRIVASAKKMMNDLLLLMDETNE